MTCLIFFSNIIYLFNSFENYGSKTMQIVLIIYTKKAIKNQIYIFHQN